MAQYHRGTLYGSRVAQLVERTHLIDSSFILGEVGGSSPPTTTITLKRNDMKQLINLFLDDIKIENFDKIEKVVFGVVAPALLIALCVALSLVQTLITK